MQSNISKNVFEDTTNDDLKDLDSDDEYNECIINPGDDRRIIICDSQNKYDGIIQCIGTIDTQYIPDKITRQKECVHGSGTVIHIDKQHNMYVLSAAHNIRGVEKQCNKCNTKTLKSKCPVCAARWKTKQTGNLIKPKDIYFARRGNTKQDLGETIARYQVDDYSLPDKYMTFSRPRGGYDMCIIVFKCTDESGIKLYKKYCSNIQLIGDATFGGDKCVSYIYGYPGETRRQENGRIYYYLHGMGTSKIDEESKFQIDKNDQSKLYIVNRCIDTTSGQSGSCIYSCNKNDSKQYLIYGVHTGGSQKQKANFGTFFDDENMKWMEDVFSANNVENMSNKFISCPNYGLPVTKESKEVLNETKEEYVADLSDFLEGKGLLKYKNALIKVGLEDIDLLNEIDDDDINEIMQEANMKQIHQKVLQTAIKEYKNGTYKPVSNDPFKKLRAKRKHLKGYIPIKTNDITGKQTKTIIFIGQTGVGKTTVINSMCNYLHKVSYEEKFRYKLICEESDETFDPTMARVDFAITKYHLENLPAIDEAVTVIDTHLIGDIQGPNKDIAIRNGFKRFFLTNCPFIDGIYFIVKASDNRIGRVQKYIFNTVLDLFGEDVKENIFILFTFSDGSEPSALKSIQKLDINCAKYFAINNAGFNLPSSHHSMFHEHFFNFGMEQFEIMFDELSKTKTKSTQQTGETLKERENITTGLKKIGDNLKLQCDIIIERNKTIEDLKKIKDSIAKNKNYKVGNSVTTKYKEKVKHRWWTTSCVSCNITCHDKCMEQMISIKMCTVFSKNGTCTVCGCNYKFHQHADFIIKEKEEIKYVTIEDMAKKYKLAKSKEVAHENIIKQVNKNINGIEQQIKETIIKIKKSVQRLQEIALNKKVSTNEEYFDLLITCERREKDIGWQDRMNELEKMKNNYKRLTQIMNNNEQNEESIINKWVNESMNNFGQKQDDEKLQSVTKKTFWMKCGNKMQINGNTIKYNGDKGESNVAYASLLSNGFHVIVFHVVHKSVNCTVDIGIASTQDYENDWCFGQNKDPFNYAYANNGRKYSNKYNRKEYGPKYGDCDTITMYLDFNKSTISFDKNGKHLGVLSTIQKGISYYVAVCLCGWSNDVSASVAVISHSKS